MMPGFCQDNPGCMHKAHGCRAVTEETIGGIMIDYELLERLTNSSHPIPPPPDMPAWKYAAIVCGLQFGPALLLLLALALLSKLFD